MVLLVHSTSPFSVEDILKDGALKPSCESGNARYAFEEDDCFEDVYLSVFHPFQTFKDMGEIAFFFKSDILKKYNTLHWSSEWLYGEFVDDKSVKYDKTKTPEENIKVWGKSYKKNRKLAGDKQFIPGLMTDEVVIRDSIPLVENLVGIYIPTRAKSFKVLKGLSIPEHFLIKTRPALTKFLKEHGYA